MLFDGVWFKANWDDFPESDIPQPALLPVGSTLAKIWYPIRVLKFDPDQNAKPKRLEVRVRKIPGEKD